MSPGDIQPDLAYLIRGWKEALLSTPIIYARSGYYQNAYALFYKGSFGFLLGKYVGGYGAANYNRLYADSNSIIFGSPGVVAGIPVRATSKSRTSFVIIGVSLDLQNFRKESKVSDGMRIE